MGAITLAHRTVKFHSRPGGFVSSASSTLYSFVTAEACTEARSFCTSKTDGSCICFSLDAVKDVLSLHDRDFPVVEIVS